MKVIVTCLLFTEPGKPGIEPGSVADLDKAEAERLLALGVATLPGSAIEGTEDSGATGSAEESGAETGAKKK